MKWFLLFKKLIPEIQWKGIEFIFLFCFFWGTHRLDTRRGRNFFLRMGFLITQTSSYRKSLSLGRVLGRAPLTEGNKASCTLTQRERGRDREKGWDGETMGREGKWERNVMEMDRLQKEDEGFISSPEVLGALIRIPQWILHRAVEGGKDEIKKQFPMLMNLYNVFHYQAVAQCFPLPHFPVPLPLHLIFEHSQARREWKLSIPNTPSVMKVRSARRLFISLQVWDLGGDFLPSAPDCWWRMVF